MESTIREEWNNTPVNRPENKKIVAGVLAIVLGYLGVHKFILGILKRELFNLL